MAISAKPGIQRWQEPVGPRNALACLLVVGKRAALSFNYFLLNWGIEVLGAILIFSIKT